MRTIALAATVAALMAATPVVALDKPVVERTGNRLSLSWVAAGPVDVYASPAADATVKTATLISRADADGHHEIDDAGTVRRYFLLRDVRTGRTARVAERMLPLEQGSNFRDVGGYTAAGGKHVRWGLIYRSGATPMLTENDIAQVKALGLKNLVDLRSSEERQIAPTKLTGIRYTAIDYSMLTMMGDRRSFANGSNLYRNFPTFFAPQLRIVFDDMIGKRGPIAYHCSAGQDRTGFTTAMVLSALGVPRATILEDYHLSTALRRPENEMAKIDPALAASNPVAKMFAAYQKDGVAAKATPLREADGRAFLDGAFDEIEKRYGSVDAYLEKEIGVTKGNLALLRATYLE